MLRLRYPPNHAGRTARRDHRSRRVRQTKRDDRGITSPYLFLGPVRYVEHESEKPMRIIWELERPMPPEFFRQVKVAAG